MKKLLAILGAAFIFFGAYSFARSECAQPFDAFVEAVQNESPNNTVRPITPAEKAVLYAKHGPPPIEEPFDINIARAPTSGMIVLVKEGCIVGHVGPVPSFVLNTMLGLTES